MLNRAGLTPRDVLSKRSRAYRELDLANRELTDDELLDLMIAEPTLLRRPLVIGDGPSVVGFNRDGLEQLIAGGES